MDRFSIESHKTLKKWIEAVKESVFNRQIKKIKFTMVASPCEGWGNPPHSIFDLEGGSPNPTSQKKI